MRENANGRGRPPPGPPPRDGYRQDLPPQYPAQYGYPGPGTYPQYPGAPYPSSYTSRGLGGIELFELLKVVKRHALVILAGTALGVAGGFIALLMETPEYEATAVVRIGEAREAMTQGIENLAQDDGIYVNPFLSDIQLLTSRSVVGEVVDTMGLRLVPEDPALRGELLHSVQVLPDAVADSVFIQFGDTALTARGRDGDVTVAYGDPVSIDGLSFVVEGHPGQDEALWTVRPREQAIDNLLSELRVIPRSQTNVVDVSFLHPSPHVAQGVVNALAQTYQQFEAQFAQERAALRREFLEEQLSGTEAQLAEAQGRLSAFQRGSQSYDAAGEIAAEQQNRMVLRVQIAELESQRRISLTMLDSLDTADSGEERWAMLRTLVSSPGIAENAVVTQMHDRFLRQRSFLDSLTAGAFGAAGSSPEVQRQRELVAAAEEDLTNSIRSHVRSLDARVGALQELVARSDSALANLPAQRAQGERLGQVVATYQSLADQLRADLQRARMAEEVSVGQADIIDLARLPYEPASSLALVKLGLGLFLGLTLGGAGAMVAEYRHRSLDTREEVEALFQVPVLGVIPRASDPFALEEAVSWTSEPGSETEAVKPAGGTGTAVFPKVQKDVQDDVYSREAFRMLCTNLLFAGWTKDAKTLSITSTIPQEGKTLVTTNLAVAMANEGLRILLVDADVWRGRVHQVFDVPVAPGLGEILQGETSVSNGAELVRKTPIPGLSLLTRGETGASPSLLNHSAPLEAILDELSHDFDLVIVDGPPVLAAGTAPVLAAATDGVMMLVQAGRTQRASIEEALRGLRAVGANLRGAVLNDPKGVTTKDWRRYAYYEYAKT